MEKQKSKWIAVIFILLFILTGFLRDYIFKSINLRLSFLYYNLPGDELSGVLSPLNQLSYTTLYYFKFLLTALFIIFYLALSWGAVKLLFPESGIARWAIIIYTGLTVLAFLIYLAGYVFGMREEFYGFSRFITGILQSPLIIMLLVPAAIIGKKKVT